MAKEKAKLSEIKLGNEIKINGYRYEFEGFEKKKTNLGKQEMFKFKCVEKEIPEGVSKIRFFERWNFQNSIIVRVKPGYYEWS